MASKLILLIVIFITSSLNLRAQNFSINVGINHSWFYYPDPNLKIIDNEFNPSFSIGFNTHHIFSMKFDLSYGIRFFNVGRYDEIKSPANLIYPEIKETVQFNHYYISFPVRTGYKVFVNLIPFLNIEPGLQIYSNLDHTNSIAPDEKRTITNEMNTFNIFVGAGLKYIFNIRSQKVSISSLLNFGLLRVSKDKDYDVTETSSRSWVDWRTREILLNIEYYFGT